MTEYNIIVNQSENLKIQISPSEVNLLEEKIVAHDNVKETSYCITNIATKNIAQVNYFHEMVVVKEGSKWLWIVLLVIGVVSLIVGGFLVGCLDP